MIFNKSINRTISRRERICDSVWSQARGLMLRRKQNVVMIFKKEKTVTLHMFFVLFPIDVLVVNNAKEIIEIKRNLQPNELWSTSKKGKYIIEMGIPSEYKVGDQLEFR